jgi:hypothetical protein
MVMSGLAPQATSDGASTDIAETGDNLTNYGAATPEDPSTFLRGWQYTDENGTPSSLPPPNPQEL